MFLEGLFAIDIAAFADPLHSVVEARYPMLDQMPEAFAANFVAIDQVVVAIPKTVATVQAVIGSVTLIVAVAVAMTAALDLVIRVHSVGFVAAMKPWIVVAYAQSVDYFACQSFQVGFQVTVAAAAAVILKHYFVGPIVDDAYLRGFAEPTSVAAAAAVVAAADAAYLEDYSAALATSVAVAAGYH